MRGKGFVLIYVYRFFWFLCEGGLEGSKSGVREVRREVFVSVVWTIVR